MYSLHIISSLMDDACSEQWRNLIDIHIHKKRSGCCPIVKVSGDDSSVVLGTGTASKSASSSSSTKRLKSTSSEFSEFEERKRIQIHQSHPSGHHHHHERLHARSLSWSSQCESESVYPTSDSFDDSQTQSASDRPLQNSIRIRTDCQRTQQALANTDTNVLQLQQQQIVPVAVPALDDAVVRSDKQSRAGWKQCKANLENCHPQFLIERVNQLETKIKDQTMVLRKTKRQLAAKNKECQKLHDQLNRKRTSDDETLTVHKHVAKLTDRGVIALGVRKSLALSSAIGFPMTSLIDTSRQTVARCESVVWATICARSRAFMNLVFSRLEAAASIWAELKSLEAARGIQELTCPGPRVSLQEFGPLENKLSLVPDIPSERDFIERDLGFSPSFQLPSMLPEVKNVDNVDISSLYCIGGTFFSGDATNSSIWRQSKLQGLLVQSSLLTNSHLLGHSTEYANAFSMHMNMWLGMYQANINCRWWIAIVYHSIIIH